MERGRLIYLMGPSGAGKDSLLRGLQPYVDDRRLRIARRIITRSAESVDEEAITVSAQDFESRESAGAFAMAWRANGLAYGIPIEIEVWLQEGYQVIVNGSRGYLNEARRRYPTLLAVVLAVEPAILRARLQARARENAEQIEARLARSASFTGSESQLADPGVIRLDNGGRLDETVMQLLTIIDAQPTCQA